jgi:hypothetical protein
LARDLGCCQAELVPDNPFYTDRIGQTLPRTSEEVSSLAWRGIAVLIQQRLDDGSLARAFPEYGCADDRGRNTVTGTDRGSFLNALEAHVPRLAEPPAVPDDGWNSSPPSGSPLDPDRTPDTATALDVIDFVALHIDQPSHRSPHSWGFDHNHYYFEADASDHLFDGQLAPGQARLQDEIEQIFRRNGIAFTSGRRKHTH